MQRGSSTFVVVVRILSDVNSILGDGLRLLKLFLRNTPINLLH